MFLQNLKTFLSITELKTELINCLQSSNYIKTLVNLLNFYFRNRLKKRVNYLIILKRTKINYKI